MTRQEVDAPKRLRMFAGPNGSGKTSLVHRLAQEFASNGLFHLNHFVNADDILRDLQTGAGVRFERYGLNLDVERFFSAARSGGRLQKGHPFLTQAVIQDSWLTAPAEACDAYAAAAVADYLRDELLAAANSFSFETVMSHRNKIDFFARAREAGYRTYLYFVATESPLVNLHRIETRGLLGGHLVPREKAIERYHRCLELVADALRHADRAFLFDNSGAAPVWLAELTPAGRLILQVPKESLPQWFQTRVAQNFRR